MLDPEASPAATRYVLIACNCATDAARFRSAAAIISEGVRDGDGGVFDKSWRSILPPIETEKINSDSVVDPSDNPTNMEPKMGHNPCQTPQDGR